MHRLRIFSRFVSFLTLGVISSVMLTSCPAPPTEADSALRVLLAAGDVAPDKAIPKGNAPIALTDILRLDATLQSIRLISSDGLATVPVTVFSGPRTIDLIDLSYVTALLSDLSIPAGDYSRVELVITAASMVLADAPNETKSLSLTENGRYTIELSFNAAPDGSRMLLIDLGGLDVQQQDDATYLLSLAASAAFQNSVQNVRIEGLIESVDTAARTLSLNVGSANVAVDYRSAQIFGPDDYMTPTGTPADLAPEVRVALLGTLGLNDTVVPSRIEILDTPDTPENENGDQVTVCHVFGENPAMATTISVSRTRLQAVLDRGGFTGPCEGGDPFTLTYTAGEGGSISGVSPQMVAPSDNGTPVTAVADEGFAFSGWSDGGTLNPRTDSAVGSDITVMAHFTKLITLEYTAGEGGTLAGNTRQAVVLGGDGTAVSAIRDNGFVFEAWSDGRLENPRTDRAVAEDIAVTANFLKLFTLSYTASAGGTLEGQTTQVLAAGAAGSAVSANANEGFVFVDWSDGRTDNPRQDLAVAADLSVTANFARLYTLTYAAGLNGSLTGALTQIVHEGGSASPITAVPDEGFGFAGWSDGRFDNPRTDVNIAGDLAVTASFTTAVSLQYNAGANGSISGPTTQRIGVGGSSAPVSAIPDDGFGFAMWSDGRTDNPRVDTDVMEDIEVTASFVEAFTATYTAGENGTLTGATTQIVNAGTDATAVTAVPAEGFGFSDWSDGNTDNPRVDTNVMADIAVTANFVPAFSLTYVAGENGTIEGPAAQTVNLGAAGQPVTAVGSDGFGFVNWSDGNTDNPRADLNVMEDIAVTANFTAIALLQYTAEENGSVTGSSTQEVPVGGNGTAVTAVPDEGYLFLQWDDGRLDNPRLDLEIDADFTVSASFFPGMAMVPVPAGSFLMGNTEEGDDLASASFADDEKPQHSVTLPAYEIGKFEVTNAQYIAFFNFMHHPSRDLLRFPTGVPWLGHNSDIWFYDTATPAMIFAYRQKESGIDYVRADRKFVQRFFPGLPDGTMYGFADMAASEVSWYGAVLFANWLSDRAGLEAVYDLDTWTPDITKNGYRLPSEAEWEKAAAWDGEKHWTYAITSDTLTTRDRVNFYNGQFLPPPDYGNDNFINPLGLVQDGLTAYLAPVGWFNGVNVSPNGNIMTVDSPSPVGAYDMSGSLVEWCEDWYSATYYGVSPTVNPTGPASGTERVTRGGAWGRTAGRLAQRTARRYKRAPDFTDGIVGFRVARTVVP